MRSQKEIIKKIEDIMKAKTDPFKIQLRILIQKLEFVNAKRFLKREYYDRFELRELWKKRCRLDEEYLKQQIKDLLFFAYDQYIEDDAFQLVVCYQEFVVLIWLMGKKYDDLLVRIMSILTSNLIDNKILDMIIERFGWKIATFFQPREKPRVQIPDEVKRNIIIPENGNGRGVLG